MAQHEFKVKFRIGKLQLNQIIVDLGREFDDYQSAEEYLFTISPLPGEHYTIITVYSSTNSR